MTHYRPCSNPCDRRCPSCEDWDVCDRKCTACAKHPCPDPTVAACIALCDRRFWADHYGRN